jgi:hypothetical protein
MARFKKPCKVGDIVIIGDVEGLRDIGEVIYIKWSNNSDGWLINLCHGFNSGGKPYRCTDGYIIRRSIEIKVLR